MEHGNTLIFKQHDFHLFKEASNKYSFGINVHNDLLHLPTIVDFNLLKLIYDLNGDVYETIKVIVNEENTQATIFAVMRHLFEDLGLPQRYSYLNVEKKVNIRDLTFLCTSKEIPEHIKSSIPYDAELLPIDTFECKFHIDNNPHTMNVNCKLTFQSHLKIPPVAEKLVSMILYKVFKRVKDFIENIVP